MKKLLLILMLATFINLVWIWLRYVVFYKKPLSDLKFFEFDDWHGGYEK